MIKVLEKAPGEYMRMVSMLDAMKEDGWAELEVMDSEDPGALEGEIREAAVPQMRAQQDRIHAIRDAQTHVVPLLQALEKAAAIEPATHIVAEHMPEPVAPIDVSAKTDEELETLIEICEGSLRKRPVADYRLFEAIRTPAAKLIVKELKSQYEACARYAESVSANMDAARSELEARRAAREKKKASDAAFMDGLAETLEEMRARISELEGSRV